MIVRSYSEQVAVQFNQERLIARLTSLFSLVALLLASVGVYGVVAYGVSRRTGEIGIRMALGADRNRVLTMILWAACRQLAVAVAIGFPLSTLCSNYLAHQLYGVARFDPLMTGGATVVLSACALLAGFLPARRAASIQPVQALRSE